MTADQFRTLALGLPESTAGSHMNHPDFRVGGKIFATIAPDGDRGMVKLTVQQQAVFVGAEPAAYEPCRGACGARGATYVRFEQAREPSVERALALAWRNTAPKGPKGLIAEYADGLPQC